MSSTFDDTVFDEPLDDDMFEPGDGRDGQPYEGSSDSPESMTALDPLRKHLYLLDDDLTAEDEDSDEETVEQEWTDDEISEEENQ
ncbi:MAG: hypothetical protein ABWX63_05690 [Paeniglutamicibacter terrestris]|jgi:hypothetical protein|uniref:Uncharacterized protein n=1 Tax=Paeniglutamicibacter terrestris TaxID=2723403 RepID=A0ABX1FZQ1_9MICC|nr:MULTISPECIES: hypothetical protein [Paeniglutamicibacter]ASN38346.1 hypothetical protein CGQ24_04520 [Arthrobacter sp. 7749]NKG19420.1 hypothetical protein [Paeniglutamicibacter terrestris]QXQ09671.1 hypothetical protein KUF55_14570 [Paeniglutamicibacter sp. Y32M11]